MFVGAISGLLSVCGRGFPSFIPESYMDAEPKLPHLFVSVHLCWCFGSHFTRTISSSQLCDFLTEKWWMFVRVHTVSAYAGCHQKGWSAATNKWKELDFKVWLRSTWCWSDILQTSTLFPVSGLRALHRLTHTANSQC